jgi:hypothetical protein
MKIMKMKNKISIGILLLTILMWSCESNNSSIETASLKQAINTSAATLNTAVTNVSSSRAFSLLTMSDDGGKSVSGDSIYKVYIGLDQIKGVYNYKPVPSYHHGISLIRYFTKTADASKMVVNMPLKKVEHPRWLREYKASDSTLTNNFSIAVSGYHNNYNNYWDYEYLLASEISIDNVVAGKLNINTVISPKSGTDYASQYAFTDGYTADYKYLSGDTTVSSFGISKGNVLLYEEKRQTVRNDTVKFGREHMYTLTIGNVQIVRKSGIVAPAVYLNGVLQTNAVVEIVDKEADHEASVCKKRDIKITFDDGTSSTVSALIGESVDNIKLLFDSLHSVYFAAYIVDWIAYDIYYSR